MKEAIVSRKKELKGKVVSNSMQKTVVVEVEIKKPHPLYKKIVKSWKKYKAHAEDRYEIGDEVMIREHKPFSKQKKWIVVGKVVKK